MGVGSAGYLYKPRGENSGNGVVILPRQYGGNVQSVSVVGSNNQVFDTADHRYNSAEYPGGVYDLNRPGGSYGGPTQIRVTLDNGQNVFFGGGGSGRNEGDVIKGGNSQLSAGGSQIGFTEQGNEYVIPSFADFNVEAPFVNFGEALGIAQDVGAQNADIFFENIIRSKDQALGLVDTDVQGIKNALDQLLPIYREQGEQDLATNIGRAGQIDRANFARIPEFNRFNQGEVEKVNTFNRAERLKSIEQSGIDYRDRVNQVLDDLETQASGSLSDKLLDRLATATTRNRGADIANSSGITPLSREGRNIQDLMDVDRRVAIALDSQRLIPQIAGQAQTLLQPPEQQLPATLAQPQPIPLNASNAADKIPVTSNISAGAAQQSLGTQATEVQVIPPATVLGQNLGAQQFNASGLFQQQMAEFGVEQAQLSAVDSATQSALNQDKADEIRDEQFAAFQENLDQQQSAQNISAIGNLLGGVGGVLASTVGNSGKGGNSIGQGILNGVTDVLGLAQEGVGAVIDAASGALDAGFGDGDGAISIGDTRIDSAGFDNLISQIGDFFSGNETPSGNISGGGPFNAPPTQPSEFDVSSTLTPSQRVQFDSGFSAKPQGSEVLVTDFREIANGFEDAGLDAQTVSKGASVIGNWNNLTPSQQMSSASQIGLSVLSNKGMVTPQQAQMIGNAGTAISVLSNPKATAAERATSLGILAASASQPYLGPTAGANTTSAVQAFGIITNPRASVEQKATALAAIGIRGAAANNLISQTAGGNALAALSVFNTATNWNKMTPVQQATSLIQTSSSVYSAMSQASAGASAATQGTGASILNFGAQAAPGSYGAGFLPAAGVAAGAYVGSQQIAGMMHLVEGDTLSVQEQAALALPTFFTSFLANPVSKYTGSGKDSGQAMRDGWRKGLDEIGLAKKKGGTYVVPLADGSEYNIGIDGGEKLKNVDGSERNSFDIDWGNKVAVNAIPDAHLFAIASGLDPTSNKKFDTFHRAVSQTVNAATSNTNDPNGVRNNFKTMMKNIDPRQLAMRVETLRLTNGISDQEYGVYVDRINQIYGTQITPTDRGKAQNFLIQSLKNRRNKISSEEKSLLNILTDSSEQRRSQERLQARLSRDAQ